MFHRNSTCQNTFPVAGLFSSLGYSSETWIGSSLSLGFIIAVLTDPVAVESAATTSTHVLQTEMHFKSHVCGCFACVYACAHVLVVLVEIRSPWCWNLQVVVSLRGRVGGAGARNPIRIPWKSSKDSCNNLTLRSLKKTF